MSCHVMRLWSSHWVVKYLITVDICTWKLITGVKRCHLSLLLADCIIADRDWDWGTVHLVLISSFLFAEFVSALFISEEFVIAGWTHSTPWSKSERLAREAWPNSRGNRWNINQRTFPQHLPSQPWENRRFDLSLVCFVFFNRIKRIQSIRTNTAFIRTQSFNSLPPTTILNLSKVLRYSYFSWIFLFPQHKDDHFPCSALHLSASIIHLTAAPSFQSNISDLTRHGIIKYWWYQL